MEAQLRKTEIGGRSGIGINKYSSARLPGQLEGTNDQFEEWWRNVTAEHCSDDRKKCNVVEGLVWGPVTTQGSGGGGNYWHHRGDWDSFYLSLVVSFMVADHCSALVVVQVKPSRRDRLPSGGIGVDVIHSATVRGFSVHT